MKIFERITKRYALQNYYLRRNFYWPDTLPEILDYWQQHNDLPFLYGGDNWPYDAMCERQRRKGVYASQYLTPDRTACQMAALAVRYFDNDSRIVDACCGTGQLTRALLLEGVHPSALLGFDADAELVDLYERLYPETAALRMQFHEIDFRCENVIANPPFSLEKWGEELWVNDPFGRNFAGLPPSSSGDFAWVQHMVKSMADVSGRMAVVLPQGALFRKGVEGSIRQKLLEMDLIEAVIGLAPNLFYGTGLAACILVLRKRKPAKHKKKVLIADASRLFRRGRAQNYLEPEHAAEILGWYRGFADVQDAVRVVSLDEIKAEDWTLNISRYVLPPLQEDIPPLPEAIAAFKDALTRCRKAEERLAQVMTEGGWLQ